MFGLICIYIYIHTYSMFIYILVYVSWFQLPQHGGHRYCGWEHGGIEIELEVKMTEHRRQAGGLEHV